MSLPQDNGTSGPPTAGEGVEKENGTAALVGDVKKQRLSDETETPDEADNASAGDRRGRSMSVTLSDAEESEPEPPEPPVSVIEGEAVNPDPWGDLDPEAEVVDLNHHRLARVDERIDRLKAVSVLTLRWNMLKTIENLSPLVTLTELELYDNQITEITGLEALVNLEILDISFNRIRKIQNLGALTKLRKLFLCANKIAKIENLEDLTNLETLELGDNRLRAIENVGHLSKLREFYVGKNKITRLQNLHELASLELLSIQSNRIVKLENLDKLPKLEQLYVSHNGIQKIEGLDNNGELTTLDLAGNRIKLLENVGHLTKLEEFWFNDNLLEDWHQVDNLRQNPGLKTVYFERNPIWQDGRDPNYRRKIKLALPNLQQIDATMCR